MRARWESGERRSAGGRHGPRDFGRRPNLSAGLHAKRRDGESATRQRRENAYRQGKQSKKRTRSPETGSRKSFDRSAEIVERQIERSNERNETG